jgi:hypothetical protein
MANTALGGGVHVDGIEEHPRVGLKTPEEQGGTKVDSAGAEFLGTDALASPSPPIDLPSFLPSPI